VCVCVRVRMGEWDAHSVDALRRVVCVQVKKHAAPIYHRIRAIKILQRFYRR
jgi:hypothetical protein